MRGIGKRRKIVVTNAAATNNNKMFRARPGFEPGTSRTLSENHTPRPTSQTTGRKNDKFTRGKEENCAPRWARTTNLSVNSRTR